jgi:hypothetical protein
MTVKHIYFALVNATDTVFGPQFLRNDIESSGSPISFNIEGKEGSWAVLTLRCKNPYGGLLRAGQPVWIWVSQLDEDEVVTPLFFGRILGIPTDFLAETVTLQYAARRDTYVDDKQLVAEGLKVKPNYDPVFVDASKRDDADTVLEGYTVRYYVNRTTLDWSVSDILVGEEGPGSPPGPVIFSAGVPYESVKVSLGEPPLRAVLVQADVGWTQSDVGLIANAGHFNTFNADGILHSWPKSNSGIGQGWYTFASGAFDFAYADFAYVHNVTTSFKNIQATHHNGDLMTWQCSDARAVVGGGAIKTLVSFDQGGTKPDTDSGTPETYHMTQGWRWDVEYNVFAILQLVYFASRKRSEKLGFLLSTDVQSVLTEPDVGQDVTILSLSGADVSTGLLDVKHWISYKGLPVLRGTIIQTDAIPGEVAVTYQLCTFPGTAGSIEPTWSPFEQDITSDNGVQWTSLGTSYTSAHNIVKWKFIANTGIALGQLCTDDNSQGVFVCVQPGTAMKLVDDAGNEVTQYQDHRQPPWVFSAGAPVADGSVIWASLGPMGSGTIDYPIGDERRSSYFPQGRGQQSVQYLINRARAQLVARSRCVKITFNAPWEQVVPLTLRMNAQLFDHRLPGGQAIGKITAYKLSANETPGLMIGEVTMECAVGFGAAVSGSDGTPVYVNTGYVTLGYQQYTGGITVLGSTDVGYTPPAARTVDDGLTFPLTWSTAVAEEFLETGGIPPFLGTTTPLGGFGPGANHQSGESPAADAVLSHLSSLSVLVSDFYKRNPTYYRLALKPVTNGPFVAEYEVVTTQLQIPKQIDLASPVEI